MGTMGKYLLIGIPLLVVAILLASCATTKVFRQQQQFYQANIVGNKDIELHSLSNSSGILHYAAAGNPQRPALVFIHGTPGSWRDLSGFLVAQKLRQSFQIFSIDRPGWGASVITGDHAMTSFAYQGEQIALLLRQIRQQTPHRAIILVGHSLGASIAPRIAADHPQLVDAMLLLSGSYDPLLARPRRHHRVGQWPLINRLIGKSLRKANKEMLVLNQELLKMAGQWEGLSIPVTVIQGDKDPLVDPENARFIQQVLSHNSTLTVIRLKETGHFTHLQSQQLIVENALELLNTISKPE